MCLSIYMCVYIPYITLHYVALPCIAFTCTCTFTFTQTSHRTGNHARKTTCFYKNERGPVAKRRIGQCLAPKISDPFFGHFRVLPQCQLIFIGSCNACRLAAFSQNMRFKVSKVFFCKLA